MMTVLKTIVTTVIVVPNNPPAPPGMIHTKTFESKRKRETSPEKQELNGMEGRNNS